MSKVFTEIDVKIIFYLNKILFFTDVERSYIRNV